MANNPNQDKFNLVFTDQMTDARLRMELIVDAVNVMDEALSGIMELLVDQGSLPADAAGLKQYQKGMKKLRELGLKAKAPTGPAKVQCPGCKTMLRIEGKPGDRCEWCGHNF